MIHNRLNDLKVNTQNNEILIDISKHIKDSGAFAVIKYKNKFVKEINDIPSICSEKGLYENGNIVSIESVKLGDLINEQKITYYNIPIYDDYQKDDFNNAYKLLDDYDDVINKVDPDYWYTLLVNPDSQDCIESRVTHSGEDYIHAELNEEDFLEQIDKSGCFIPKVYAIKQNLLENEDNTLYLPFDIEKKLIRYWFSENNFKVYLRDILIRQHLFEPIYLPSVLEIDQFNINIHNINIMPDVSRNKFDESVSKMVNYAITKAVISTFIELPVIAPNEKKLLEKFIGKYYNVDSILAY